MFRGESGGVRGLLLKKNCSEAIERTEANVYKLLMEGKHGRGGERSNEGDNRGWTSELVLLMQWLVRGSSLEHALPDLDHLRHRYIQLPKTTCGTFESNASSQPSAVATF
jgi:hypothetical protein